MVLYCANFDCCYNNSEMGECTKDSVFIDAHGWCKTGCEEGGGDADA